MLATCMVYLSGKLTNPELCWGRLWTDYTTSYIVTIICFVQSTKKINQKFIPTLNNSVNALHDNFTNTMTI